MFRSCENKGFQLTFSNGYLVSCQFGAFNYCERRSFEYQYGDERKEPLWDSKDAEVAVIKDGEFVTGDIIEAMGVEISNDGMVAGWVNADDVAKIIAYVSAL